MLRALALCLLLVAAPAWAQSLAAIPALDSPVVDTTGTLDATQKQQLEQQALALQQRKGSQLQVLIVPSTQPEDIFDYTQRVFDQWKLGRQGVDDAVILVVAKDDRRVRIHTGYGLEGAIPDAVANRVIQEYLVPKFRAGDYAGGVTDATAVLVKLIDGESLPAPVSTHRSTTGDGSGSDWLFALFAAFVVATLVRGMFGRAPAGLRGLFTGGAAAGVALLLSSLIPAGIAGVFGLLYGLASVSTRGAYARHRDWGGWGGGGGGWGGGGFGGGGQQFFEGHTQLIAQGVHHQVGHLASAFLEAICHQAIKGIGVGQSPSRRPSRSLDVFHKHTLNLFCQAPIARPCLADHFMHQAMRVEEVTCRLLKLALQAICFTQAAQVEVDQLRLRAGVIRQLALEIIASLYQAQTRPHQLPLRLAFALA